ncbi:MFS transporter [Streptomyces sediminimaris]|uniref:MFS transporter n=1 Tax=Streptomyces sediminimaris TaxID=3383721 RepID=UPI00399C377C
MSGSPATHLRRAVSPVRHGGSPRTVLLVMCAGYFLVLLDVTIVNVALPDIGSGLGTGVGGLQWVVDGYALALAALMLTSGTVGDLHGHRRVVLAGLVVFGAGSLACGLAPDVPVLVAARVVQGVGAALLLPGTLAIISRAFPDRAARARAPESRMAQRVSCAGSTPSRWVPPACTRPPRRWRWSSCTERCCRAVARGDPGGAAQQDPGRSTRREAARALRVCVVTDLLPAEGAVCAEALAPPLCADYPSLRDSHTRIRWIRPAVRLNWTVC